MTRKKRSKRPVGSRSPIWLFHVFSSERKAAKNQWTVDQCRRNQADIWAESWNRDIISFGGPNGPAKPLTTKGLGPNSDEHQLARMRDAVSVGDVVVATLGNKAIGWGIVTTGYAHKRADLRHLWEKSLERFRQYWFLDVIGVEWQEDWFDSPKVLPKSAPLIPTLRSPRDVTGELRAFLRRAKVPV